MRVSNELIEEIARSNDIIEVISGYIQIKKRGKSFIGLCPFHPDKHPSLHISQEKQVYHCFSCKASGNVYSFVQNIEKITFMDAVEKLAQKAGIELNKTESDPDKSNELSVLLEINKAAANYFRKNLENLKGAEKEFIKKYLENRKIGKDISQKFGLGYSLKSRDSLLHHFSEEGIFSPAEIENAGLILKNESGKYYDRFRGRLMFPIFNESGKVIGFGGRKLFEEEQGGKYINSPETKIYVKSRNLYGLNFAKEKIRNHDYIILVEGYMDLISLMKNGFENVVASSGTALTEEQVKIISRYTNNVFILFDSDFAGIKAAKRGIEIILEAGLDLSIISLPDGEDPDSFINKNGKEAFEKYIEKRQSVINFISGIYKKEGKLDTVKDKSDFVKEIIGYIGRIPDKIKRAFFIKEISKMYSLYESDLRDELEKVTKEIKKSAKTSLIIPSLSIDKNKDKLSEISREEHDLIDIFINGNEEAINYLENNLEISFLRNAHVKRIAEYFLDEYINHGKVELSKAMLDLEKEEEKMLVSKIAMDKHEISRPKIYSSDSILCTDVKPDYSLKFAKDLINKFKIRELELKRDELKKDASRYLEVFEISKQINDLHKENQNSGILKSTKA